MNAQHLVGETKHIAIDWTKYVNYRKLCEEETQHYSAIPVTDGLQEGGAKTSKAWHYWYQYLEKNLWEVGPTAETTNVGNALRSPRILSLGCGYGGNEISIANGLNEPYQVIATDLNEDLFEKARSNAEGKKLNICFYRVDLNYVRIKENSFDVIFALGTLHHILNLEHLFFQIYRGLKQNGQLIIMDMIGKTRTLFWRENIEYADKIVREMPAKYTIRAPDTDNIIPAYNSMLHPAGMEGIRQEEIEKQLDAYFYPLKQFRYGSFMRLICLNPILAGSFDPALAEDREYLEYLFRLDLEQIRAGNLRPTELFAVMKKKSTWQIVRTKIISCIRSLRDRKQMRNIPITIKELMLLVGLLKPGVFVNSIRCHPCESRDPA